MDIRKTVKDYEELYEASTLGYIYSLSFNHSNKNKVLKGRKNRKGYLVVALWNKGKRKDIPVHRLVLETFKDNPENKPEINHKDGNKENNNIHNLEFVTSKENYLHAVKNNLKSPEWWNWLGHGRIKGVKNKK